MHPVHYFVRKPEHFTRIQLAARFIAFCALGVLGLSFGMVFAFLYLALPVFAASRVSARSPERYLQRDSKTVLTVLRWFAALSAWAGLVAEALPGRSPEEAVSIEVEALVAPTPSGALFRVVTGLPSALVLAFLGWIGVFVWVWAAFSILLTQHVGTHAFRYLVGIQRWSVRLLVYQAALVDDYPPFSFADTPAPQPLPLARAITP